MRKQLEVMRNVGVLVHDGTLPNIGTQQSIKPFIKVAMARGADVQINGNHIIFTLPPGPNGIRDVIGNNTSSFETIIQVADRLGIDSEAWINIRRPAQEHYAVVRENMGQINQNLRTLIRNFLADAKEGNSPLLGWFKRDRHHELLPLELRQLIFTFNGAQISGFTGTKNGNGMPLLDQVLRLAFTDLAFPAEEVQQFQQAQQAQQAQLDLIADAAAAVLAAQSAPARPPDHSNLGEEVTLETFKPFAAATAAPLFFSEAPESRKRDREPDSNDAPMQHNTSSTSSSASAQRQAPVTQDTLPMLGQKLITALSKYKNSSIGPGELQALMRQVNQAIPMLKHTIGISTMPESVTKVFHGLKNHEFFSELVVEFDQLVDDHLKGKKSKKTNS